MANKHYVTERDLKELNRKLKVGDRVYGVVSIEQSMSPWEDSQLYVERTVTSRSWITGQWMVDGTMSVADMVHTGGAYLQPPAGMRNLAGPGPQVAGPLPAGQEHDRTLNESELTYLEGRVATATRNDASAGRGRSGSRWW